MNTVARLITFHAEYAVFVSNHESVLALRILDDVRNL